MARTSPIVNPVPVLPPAFELLRRWLANFRIAHTTMAIMHGTGTPETVVSAPVGTVFLRDDGGASTVLYVKEGGGTGNTGWRAV